MLKVGLVGYGFMGNMHIQCYDATGLAKVVAVADVEEDRRKDAKAKYCVETYATLQEMLASADIDAVDICTPTYLHEECVVAAAVAGKDIMCEKPMALTVEACDKMIAAVEKAGVKMMVGQVIRFWPEYQVIKDILDSGKYGKIEWMSARRLSPPPTWAWQDWLTDPLRSGGAIHDLHIHDLDFLVYILGMPKQVFCQGQLGPNGGLDNIFTTCYGQKDGAKSFAEGSLDLSPSFPFTMALIVACEGATIKLDSGASPSLMVYPMDGDSYAPIVPEVSVGASAGGGGNISSLGGYFLEIKYFAECVKAGMKPEIVTPWTAREAVRLCLAARKSAENAVPINL
jgi:predicted dehydrogenase